MVIIIVLKIVLYVHVHSLVGFVIFMTTNCFGHDVGTTAKNPSSAREQSGQHELAPPAHEFDFTDNERDAAVRVLRQTATTTFRQRKEISSYYSDPSGRSHHVTKNRRHQGDD